MNALGRILTVIVAVIIAVAALAGGYYIYLNANNARIGEKSPTAIVGDAKATLEAGETYRAVTYNVGFGAHDHDFSFFLSEGRTIEGDATKGTGSRAGSEKAVRANIAAAAEAVRGLSPDIAVYQEVDVDADRSYHVNELQAMYDALLRGSEGEDEAMADGAAPTYSYTTNFHTGYLLYPPTKPIGRIKDSGVLTVSRYEIAEAERRSLPVEGGFLKKFFDLDRCFHVCYMPVEGTDRRLALINLHLSAYDEGGRIRAEQTKELMSFLAEEREKGNWVIAGGDWNQCFPGSIDAFKGRMEVPSWAQAFDETVLPDGFRLVAASNADVIATCRDTSIPWTPGVSYETILDGWVVSDNVAAWASNIDTDYVASDHNPVLLTFALRDQ